MAVLKRKNAGSLIEKYPAFFYNQIKICRGGKPANKIIKQEGFGMKKWMSILMMVVLLFASVTAMADDTILLRVWGGVPAESGPQASIDLFNEAFKDKGIQAEYERFVNDETGNLKLEACWRTMMLTCI